MMRRFGRALFSVGLIGLVFTGCGRSADCQQEAWAGRCVLKGVSTVRTIERFPVAYVVVESWYEPAPQSAPGAPAALRKEFTAEASQESDLKDYLNKFQNVDCHAEAPRGAPCDKMAIDLAIPPFQASAKADNEAPQGCAQIEKGGGTGAAKPIADEFRFEENAVAASPDVQAMADKIARTIKSDPKIECVALSGQISFGEDLSLADQRARLVKDLLIQRGVDAGHLIIFNTTVPIYADIAPQDRFSNPEHRHVRLTIVLTKAQ